MKPPILTSLAKEKEIVTMLSNGMRASKMARELEMEQQRLAVILASMRKKYSCNNSTHLVAYFLRNKLIE